MTEKFSYCIIIVINTNIISTFLYVLIEVSRDLILAKKWMPLSVYVCYANRLSVCSYPV